MTPAFEEILKTTFPTVFGRGLAWGFQCDSGWFPLLYKLAAGIEAHNRTVPENYWVYAVQVKEKLGGLRFYIEGPTECGSEDGLLNIPDIAYAWIDEAERQAAITCEICSRHGILRQRSMVLQTLCDDCLFKLGCKRCSQYRNF